MRKFLNLNICICIVVTFLFEFLDASNMIPSQYRLGIAAIILIIDVICAIIAIIESRKKNHSIKMFLDDYVCTLVSATIFTLLVFNVVPSRFRSEVESITILYLIIGLVYNFVKDWKSMKSVSKNRWIILVILFVLDAIILRYLLNDRMKENKSKEVFLQTDIFVLISLIVLIPLHLDIVHPIIGAVLSGSVIIYQAIAMTHNIKERGKKKKQKKSGAIPSV